MSTPGRFSSRNRALLITLGVLVVAVVVGTVVLAIGHSGGSPQPVAAPTTSSPTTTGSGALPSFSIVGTITASSLPSVLGSDPTMSTIGAGSTDPEGFAQRVSTAVLAYDWQTDFEARNDDLMLLVAPDPYGEATGLEQDVIKLTPTGATLNAIRQKGSAVSFGEVQAQESAWAKQRMTANGAPPGAHGIDVSGIQTFKEAGQAPTSAPVTISMVVVCPPTTEACTVIRIYSGRLQDALGG